MFTGTSAKTRCLAEVTITLFDTKGLKQCSHTCTMATFKRPFVAPTRVFVNPGSKLRIFQTLSKVEDEHVDSDSAKVALGETPLNGVMIT